MKATLLSALAVALLLANSPRLVAQDTATKPVVAAALPSYNRILQIAGFVGKLADDPDLPAKIEDQIKQVTQGKGLAGLDKAKPWGVVLLTDGVEFRPLAFVPVTNLKEFLDVLGTVPNLPPMDVQDKGNGVYVINDIVVKEKGGWAFIAQNEAALENVPADPIQLLGGLNSQYDVALRAFVNNIPPLYRQMAAGLIQQSAETSLEQRLPGEDDQAYELRKKMAMANIDQISTAINEMDQLTLGWKVDDTARKTFIDVAISAMADTKTAKDMDRLKDATSDNSGLVLPGAAGTFLYAGKWSQEEIEQSAGMVAMMRSQAMKAIDEDGDIPDDKKEALKEVAGDLIEVAKKTIEGGKFDMGGSVVLGEKRLTVVAGGLIADGTAVEAALKKVVTLMQNEPDFPGVKFNVESHAGVNFHTLAVPMTEDEAKEMFGDKLDIVVGTGPKAAYIALGPDSMSKLKSAIDKSQATPGKTVLPMQIMVAIGPILKFAQQFHEEADLEVISKELEKYKDNDRVNVTVTSIKDGARVRIEAEEGAIKAAAMAAKAGGDL